MKKAGVIKKLVAAGIEHDPKSTQAELEKLLPAGGAASADDTTSGAPPEKTEAKEAAKRRRLARTFAKPVRIKTKLCETMGMVLTSGLKDASYVNGDDMKPLGRKPSRFPNKVDHHPGEGFVNWWENAFSRGNQKAERQAAKKEIHNGEVDYKYRDQL